MPSPCTAAVHLARVLEIAVLAILPSAADNDGQLVMTDQGLA